MKKITDGFIKKDTKAFKPDKKTGKWRGRVTKNGQFVTIKPSYSGEIKIKDSVYKIELWTFANKWGTDSLFYKLYEEKTEKELF